jgi:hypothetical protein
MTRNKRQYNDFMRAILHQNFKSVCKDHNIECKVEDPYHPKSVDEIRHVNAAFHKLMELDKEGKVDRRIMRLSMDFCNAINERAAFRMLKRCSKPAGVGWKTMSIYNAPEGAKVEIAAQGLNKRRGVVKGVNIGCWSETIAGIHTKGITIKPSNLDNVVFNTYEDGSCDVEDVRCDWWRVIGD